MTFAGAPATRLCGGTSRVTTEFEATTLSSPILTPRVIVAFAPIQTLSPMRIGELMKGRSLNRVPWYPGPKQ
jgi:hypothetical protein